MPISDAELSTLNSRLADLSARLKTWNAPLDKLIQDAAKQGRLGDGLDAAQQMEAERRRAGTGVPDEILEAVGDLAGAFRQATPDQRDRIRGMLDGKDILRNHFYGFIARSADRIRAGVGKSNNESSRLCVSASLRPEQAILEQALAAAAIEDARMDSRDLLISLGDLWLAAERAGIDPTPAFRDASMLASPRGGGRSGSCRDLLRDFHASAYLASVRRGG